MHKHTYFDLLLHDDAELSSILNCAVVQRTTLHEWPLSCVQRVSCEDGQTYIYKVQSPPTVEPAFYENARSPLLVSAQVIADNTLIMEDIQAPHLNDVALSDAAKLAAVDDIVRQISQIEGDLPSVADLRTESAWAAYVETIVSDINMLIEEGKFQQVTQLMGDTLKKHADSSAVMNSFSGEMGLVHGDLWGENVLVTSDGYRVIDWQRPIFGPTALDRSTLLASVGLDPVPVVGPGIVQLRRLLLIAWLAQAARYWFPEGADHYDGQIAQLLRELDASAT